MKLLQNLRTSLIPLTVLLMASQGLVYGGNEDEIRLVESEYIEAFNQKDSQALSSLWAEDAEYVNLKTGSVVRGRKAIEAYFSQLFSEEKSTQLRVVPHTITFPKPHTAEEIGTAIINSPGKNITETTYKAEYLKQSGKWLLTRVSEIENLEPSSHYEHLKKLEWLVGNWVDKDQDTEVISHYSWDKNKNFLTHRFTVKIYGNEGMQGHQIIAWDPDMQKIRSWVFDSDGGFGEGTWKQTGMRWIQEVAYTLPDGRKASAIHIYTKISPNAYLFESRGRMVEGEMLPNIDPVKIVRQENEEKR